MWERGCSITSAECSEPEPTALPVSFVVGMGTLENSEELPERLLLFDGVCNLCNASVRFVIQRDPKARIRFAPLSSELGNTFAKQVGQTGPEPTSIVYLRKGAVIQRSTAALYVARDLSGAWPLLFGFIVVPRVLRDLVYDLIARKRYAWFGRTDQCMVPPPDMATRFLS